jgi:general secretion pathway protein H
MNRDHHREGFSLIEMMVVLALIAIFAAISLPYTTTAGDRTRLTSTARLVAARFDAVRAAAIEQNRPLSLVIDLKKRSILDSRNAVIDILPSDFALTITSAQNEAIDGSAAFVFFADGGSTGGKVTLTKGNRSASVNLNWLTGAAIVAVGSPQ